MELAPEFWYYTMDELLGVSDQRLAQKLWDQYPKPLAMRYLLIRCATPAMSLAVTQQRVRQLSALLEPNVLLATVEKLVQPGRPRPREIRDLQERILGLLDHEGHWKWLD